MEKKRVFVTGATGMIGAHLAGRLVADGHEVTVLARANASLLRLRDIESHIQIVRGDLTSSTDLGTMLERVRPEVVYHLASTPFNPPTIPTRDHLDVNV